MHQAKLSKAQKSEICQLYATGRWGYAGLGLRYGVSTGTIAKCVKNPD